MKDKKLKEKLDILKKTRPREVMPRPVVFEDKTKYKRSKQKIINKKIIDE